jgi:hypothetical protein
MLTLMACGSGGTAKEGERVSSADECGGGLQACPAFEGCDRASGYICLSSHVACEGGGRSIACVPQAEVDLELTFAGHEQPIDPGRDVPVAATIVNRGPDAASAAVLSIRLPSGVTLVEPQQACTDRAVEGVGGDRCAFEVAIEPGAEARIDLVLAVDATVAGASPTFTAELICQSPVGELCNETDLSDNGGTYTLGAP